MTFPLPPSTPNGLDNYSIWLSFLNNHLPARYQDGNAGSWFLFLKGILGDTVEQMTLDSVYMPLVGHPNSPDDILKFISVENGILKYAGEPNDSWRQRIEQFWDVTPGFGTDSTLIQLLNQTGWFSSIEVYPFLTGAPSGVQAPYDTPRMDIPPYPSSHVWWSQFSVVLTLNSILGAGIESALIKDEQLATLRNFIQYYKPVDWVCREIILTYEGTPGSVARYDTGELYDGSIVYSDSGVIPSDFGFERHKGQLNLNNDVD